MTTRNRAITSAAKYASRKTNGNSATTTRKNAQGNATLKTYGLPFSGYACRNSRSFGSTKFGNGLPFSLSNFSCPYTPDGEGGCRSVIDGLYSHSSFSISRNGSSTFFIFSPNNTPSKNAISINRNRTNKIYSLNRASESANSSSPSRQ